MRTFGWWTTPKVSKEADESEHPNVVLQNCPKPHIGPREIQRTHRPSEFGDCTRQGRVAFPVAVVLVMQLAALEILWTAIRDYSRAAKLISLLPPHLGYIGCCLVNGVYVDLLDEAPENQSVSCQEAIYCPVHDVPSLPAQWPLPRWQLAHNYDRHPHLLPGATPAIQKT